MIEVYENRPPASLKLRRAHLDDKVGGLVAPAILRVITCLVFMHALVHSALDWTWCDDSGLVGRPVAIALLQFFVRNGHTQLDNYNRDVFFVYVLSWFFRVPVRPCSSKFPPTQFTTVRPSNSMACVLLWATNDSGWIRCLCMCLAWRRYFGVFRFSMNFVLRSSKNIKLKVNLMCS